ncbi:lipopolysaccharide transport periplasmic protein LptA [Legionella londiniensis]|uniref:OstA family protein n=1 Tax=Legionella londiniensis TaxID=45068 RepID=A0A0W0VL01_9GAMM|nr:lipopolysaccharide transport periplasmic protein LptA [Legionella londiniensis]KTD20723.1 OstA family protein [Legionella londiniensis]STX92804.1 OstA family protein [Legionella londiniensis]
MIQNKVSQKKPFYPSALSVREFCCSILLLFLIPCHALALPNDREQVLMLQADTADLNQETHRGIYIGDVQLDQGTTHVRAAEAITVGDANNKLVMAKATGNQDAQAHYWSTPENGKPPLHAYADEIYYYPDKHLIKLIGNARVEQGKNSFSAPEIIYDTEKQHVVTQKNNKARATIIIHPEKH